MEPRHQQPSAGRLPGVLVLALWAALLVRTLADVDADQWPWYIAGFAAFLVIQLIVDARRPPAPLVHVSLAVQAAIVVLLLDIDPHQDYVAILLVLECYQAAVVLPALPRTIWVAALVALNGGSLALAFGLVEGLAYSLVQMAVGVVLAMYVVVTREQDDRRAASERMVEDLTAAQERLQVYAGQADELAAIEQRSRVAHDLGESVAGTLRDALGVSAAARGRLAEPEVAALELERLQELTKEALAQMRRAITELRPSEQN